MIKFADFLKIKKSYIFATYITKKKLYRFNLYNFSSYIYLKSLKITLPAARVAECSVASSRVEGDPYEKCARTLSWTGFRQHWRGGVLPREQSLCEN